MSEDKPSYQEGDAPPIGQRVVARGRLGVVVGWASEPGAKRKAINAHACPCCTCEEPDPLAGWWLVRLEGQTVNGGPLDSVEWPPRVEPHLFSAPPG